MRKRNRRFQPKDGQKIIYPFYYYKKNIQEDKYVATTKSVRKQIFDIKGDRDSILRILESAAKNEFDFGISKYNKRTVRETFGDKRTARHPCIACISKDSIHIHHIVPVSNGGDNRPNNLISVCQNCHSEIHGYGTGVDYGKPFQPKIIQNQHTDTAPEGKEAKTLTLAQLLQQQRDINDRKIYFERYGIVK